MQVVAQQQWCRWWHGSDAGGGTAAVMQVVAQQWCRWWSSSDAGQQQGVRMMMCYLCAAASAASVHLLLQLLACCSCWLPSRCCCINVCLDHTWPAAGSDEDDVPCAAASAASVHLLQQLLACCICWLPSSLDDLMSGSVRAGCCASDVRLSMVSDVRTFAMGLCRASTL